MALALQSRCTVAFDTPTSRAMVRTDQRVRCAGGWVAPTMIFSLILGSICSFRPRPLASLSPATPAWRNRCSQWITNPSAQADFPGSLLLAQTIGAVENDPGSAVIPLSHGRTVDDGAQCAPLFRTNIQCTYRSRHEQHATAKRYLCTPNYETLH